MTTDILIFWMRHRLMPLCPELYGRFKKPRRMQMMRNFRVKE